MPPSGVCSRGIGPADAMVIVVAVGHDDDVAVMWRWSVGLVVPWLAKKDEMIPRALTLV